jgi:hypothetical protein
VNPGDVFRWKDFPYPRIGSEVKARWFIYFGNTNVFLDPVRVHLGTTTTNRQDFQKGGRRESHRHFLFEKGKHPFAKECLLDFDEDPDAFPKKELENNPDIELKGPLDVKTLRRIYEGIYQSKRYSPKIKEDIYFSLKDIPGIGSLKKP